MLDMRRPENSRNALAWQTTIIILPVVILAGLGAFYLRQDRILVRHEAEERARLIAQELTDELWQGLTSPTSISQEQAFQIDADGALLFPPPYDKAPVPHSLNLDALTAAQAQLWSNPGQDLASLRQVFDTNLPPEFQAIAAYRLALAFAAQNQIANAVETFRIIHEKFPRSVGETGLPLALLARLKSI